MRAHFHLTRIFSAKLYFFSRITKFFPHFFIKTGIFFGFLINGHPERLPAKREERLPPRRANSDYRNISLEGDTLSYYTNFPYLQHFTAGGMGNR